MLKPSAIISALQRSLMGILRATRKSIWKKFGRVNAFRPRFPVQPQNGRVLGNEKGAPVLSTQRFGRVNATPGIEGEVVEPGGGVDVRTKDGRPVEEPKSRLESKPMRRLYGRPEETSTMGATVKSARNFRQKLESLQ